MLTKAQFKDEVTLEERIDQDPSGVANYGPAVIYRSHVEWKPEQIRTQQGEEAVSHVQVALSNVTVVGGVLTPIAVVPRYSAEARLTLDDGSQPIILRVGYAKDRQGREYVEIFA